MRAANTCSVLVTVQNALCEFAKFSQQLSCGTCGLGTIIITYFALENGDTERLNVIFRVTQLAGGAL